MKEVRKGIFTGDGKGAKRQAMKELSLDKFEEAYEIVKEVASETKLIYSDHFSARTGNKVYLKPENMQLTGPISCGAPIIRSVRCRTKNGRRG